MDTSFSSNEESGAVSIHNINPDDLNMWSQRVGQPVEDLTHCQMVKFKISNITIKLFTRWHN